MHKKFNFLYNNYYALYLLLLLFDISSGALEGENIVINRISGVKEDFGAEIPSSFSRIGDKYYHIDHDMEVNWFGAIEACRRIEGHLINLQSHPELENLRSELKSSLKYWTDLNNLVDGKQFYSLTSGTKGYFLNEGHQRRGIYTSMCGTIDSNGESWVDTENCFTGKARVICETTRPTTLSIVVW